MRKRYVNWSLYIVVLFMLILAVIAYPSLSDNIPFHFSVSGEVDSWAGKSSIFFFSVIALILVGIAESLPRLDPKKRNYDHFRKSYNNIFLAVILMFLFLEILVISYGIGKPIQNINQFILLFLGLFMLFFGNLLPKLKHNYFCGIRTTWTIADSEVWYQTHRFAGKVWVIVGLLILLCMLLPNRYAYYYFMVAIAIIGLVPVIYSYICYRKKEEYR